MGKFVVRQIPQKSPGRYNIFYGASLLSVSSKYGQLTRRNMVFILDTSRNYMYDLTLTRSVQQFGVSVHDQQSQDKRTPANFGRQNEDKQNKVSLTLTFLQVFIQYSVSLVWNCTNTRRFRRSVPILTQRLPSLSIQCS